MYLIFFDTCIRLVRVVVPKSVVWTQTGEPKISSRTVAYLVRSLDEALRFEPTLEGRDL